MLYVGQKISHLQDLRVTRFTFLKRKTALFWLKRPPKSSPLERKLQFDLLDHQEDTQGAVLSHNHCRINHITKSFMVILAKNVKIYRKLSLLWPLGCLWGSEQIFFYEIWFNWSRCIFFVTKLLLSDLPVTQKSLNLWKSVKNWSKIAKIPPWGPFWGSDQKFFFTNCFNSSIGTFFVTKVLL